MKGNICNEATFMYEYNLMIRQSKLSEAIDAIK